MLFVSGYSEDAVSIKRDDAPWGFLAKPFTVAALGERVRAILDEPACLRGDDSKPVRS